ncbi:MAG: GGDEF domain-containing protein [Phycisphaeraceae bacterium]|nr:GGDEF domain-containing protein [Phycisphaeraceae bacterium]
MNERLLEKVLDCPRLPSLPAIALQVIELTADDNVTMAQLAATIQNDQGLAGKVLKTINSAFYGLTKPCSTLAQAQIMLGLNAIKTLALGFSLVKAVKDSGEESFDYETYWRRGLYSGIAARIVASSTKAADPEEAFLGGLMQDIGMIALNAAIGPSYSRLVNSVSHERLLRAELEEIEITHPLVGSMLATRWRLPEAMVMCIKHHAQPSTAPEAFADIVQCVAIGNLAAATLMEAENPSKPMQRYLDRCQQWFEIHFKRAEEMLESIVVGAKEVAKLLELPGGKFPDPAEVIGKANDQLVTMALRNDKEVEEATRRNAELEHAIRVDELTGLATRKKFEADLEDLFQKQARQPGGEFAVIILDIDKLAEINDQLGREVGDAVITGIARRIAETFDDRGFTIARLCGAEFGVLAPGINKTEASHRAEHFRSAISSAPLDLTSCPDAPTDIEVSLSVGVTPIDAASIEAFARIEQIMHATDSAMRMARKSGGDCVRVFSPRRKKAA